jgi:hypothetical protein
MRNVPAAAQTNDAATTLLAGRVRGNREFDTGDPLVVLLPRAYRGPG